MKVTVIYNKVILASLFLLVGCTEVELCTEETHPHTADFSLKYEWKQEYYNPATIAAATAKVKEWEDENGKGTVVSPVDPVAPDAPTYADYQKYLSYLDYLKNKQIAESSIYFVVSRILNTRHDVYETNRDGLFWVKKQMEPAPEPNPDDTSPSVRVVGEVTAEYELKKTVPITNGEYFMMAFTKPTEQSNTTVPRNKVEVVNLDKFQEDNSTAANKIIMRHADARASELIKKSWEDLNPGYRYVFEPGDQDLYVARCNYLELYTTNSEFNQTFVFEPLLQYIDINFAIDFVKDENNGIVDIPTVEVKSRVIAEISGIVPQVNLSNGILNTTETKKMIANISEVQRKTAEDGTVTVFYKASFKAFGLIGGLDSQTISGPGVFRLGLYLKDPNSAKEKASRVLSNLTQKINDAGLTEMTGQPNERKKLKDRASFTIDNHIVIRVSVFNENSNEGISGWVTEGNNVDVEA